MSDELLKELYKKGLLTPPKENSWKEYGRYCFTTKRQKMAMGKIRYMFADPLSRKALFRGTVYIEYVNQDPDKVEPVNIEKLTQKLEWEGTKSDWFGLIICSFFLALYLLKLYLNSPFTKFFQEPIPLQIVSLIWKMAINVLKNLKIFYCDEPSLIIHDVIWDTLILGLDHYLFV